MEGWRDGKYNEAGWIWKPEGGKGVREGGIGEREPQVGMGGLVSSNERE